MEIRIDGNRSSAENWDRAHAAPLSEVPPLSEQQKAAAASMRISEEAYARSFYAMELERENLAVKAEKVARAVERVAQHQAPGLKIEGVWLKTFEGKFRFNAKLGAQSFLVFLREDLIDDLLESGSKSAEEQVERVIELSLPAAQATQAS